MDAGREAILRAGHANFVDAFRYLAALVPNGVVEEAEGAVCIRTGLPAAQFNPVFAMGEAGSVERVAERVDRLYRRTGTPWRLVTTTTSDDRWAPLLHELELVRGGTFPGMLLEPWPATRRDPPTGFTVEEVRDRHGVQSFLRTASIAFGAPPTAFDPLLDGFVSAAKAKVTPGHHYLGYAEGRPVATAHCLVSHRIAGVFVVGTLPEFRRRGFGEAVTWRAALDGRSEGCVASYLQASEMGRPVYERMGYRVVAEYQDWFERPPRGP